MKTETVINHFGSATAVGHACKCSPQAVAKWGKKVPFLRQFQLEVITNGELKSDFTFAKMSIKGK